MTRRYWIGQAIVEEDDAGFDAALAEAHRTRQRPVCLCCEKGAVMYIARIGDQFFTKRMPLSGPNHDPRCQSYEPPYELSGLGPLIGGAIQLDPASGMAALKLDFSLSKRGRRKAHAPSSRAKVRSKTKSAKCPCVRSFITSGIRGD